MFVTLGFWQKFLHTKFSQTTVVFKMYIEIASPTTQCWDPVINAHVATDISCHSHLHERLQLSVLFYKDDGYVMRVLCKCKLLKLIIIKTMHEGNYNVGESYVIN